MFDLVILSGRVIDPETKLDAIRNVGIQDGRIARITSETIQGREQVDATGLIVSPGFIDTHHHWPRLMGQKLAARDGRTTILDLEMGCAGQKIDEWYEKQSTWALINYGAGSSHELARATVLDNADIQAGDILDCLHTRAAKGWSDVHPTLEQGNEILKIIDQGLQAGALGCCSTLGYMRDGVSAREAFEVTKLAASYNRTTAFHFRGTPGTEVQEVNGIQELLANAAALNAPAIACHFNNAGYNLVHELLFRMQERGMNVWGEVYPYHAGCTSLNATFLKPEIWCKQLGHKYEETIQDALTGEFYTEETYKAMLEKEPVRVVIVYKCPESDIVEWMKLPGVAIATDSMPPGPDDFTWDTPFEDLPGNHPRTSGSFAKALRLAREEGIPMMHMIEMVSYTPAKHMSRLGLKPMQERGRLQEGMVADITIFDPKTVSDQSTYLKPNQPSTGIPYVLVSGEFVVKDSENVKNAMPTGKPIRFDPTTDSKLELLDEKKWKKTYYVPCDFGGTDAKGTFTCCS